MVFCDREIKILEDIAKSLSEKDLELVFVNDDEMRALNLKHRNIDKSTDVLSFHLEDVPNAILGSIVINEDDALRMSKKLGHSFEEELSILFIHGILHLLGFDHECDNGEMRNKEIELIDKFNLPKSLILRA